jgi:murein DD-endopeptidase MepM/ murein hydrolase activator NlpD
MLSLVSGCGQRAEDFQPLTDEELLEQTARERLTISQHWQDLRFPTDQQRLLDENHAGVFQPTASGRPQSAHFGSVRTVKRGRRWQSSFHEGIDIAAMERDRRHRPLDLIYAVSGGTVAYINRVAGNSNYGRYVVLEHPDPLGPVYTLYAHLAEVPEDLAEGDPVVAGDVIGRMGSSSSTGIPNVRAHLHFEVGLMLNDRFKYWYRARKQKPDHGNLHGWNLLGISPLDFLRMQKAHPEFTMAGFMYHVPRAFDLLIQVDRQLDYFERYPLLWKDRPFKGGVMLLSCAENGLPLQGRYAFPEEIEQAASLPAVLHVDEEALGRNGCHLITTQSDNRQVARRGKRLLEILSY